MRAVRAWQTEEDIHMDEMVGSTSLDETPDAAPVEDAPRGRFDDMTDGDHVRDLLGVLALVLALQLPWSAAGGAAAVPWALASLLLLVVPLALPYLARLGALPAAWTVHSTRRARVLLAMPTVGCLLAQVVLDALRVGGNEGVGPAAGVALTAAALAAVPRTCELGPVELDAAATRSWRTTTTLLGLLTAIAPVAWLAVVVADRLRVSESIRAEDDLTGLVVVVALVTILVVGALVAPAVLAAFSRTALGRRAAVVVATTWAVALFASGGRIGSEPLESVRTFVTFERGGETFIVGAAVLGYGLVLVGAVAVLATSPAVTRAAKDEGERAIGWFVTARGLLALLAFLAGVLAVATLVVAIDDRAAPHGSFLAGNGSPGLASLVPGAVVALVVGAAALKVRSMLVGRPADARRPALAATAALLGLGIVLVVVARLDEASAFVPSQHVALLTLVVGVGLPVAVVACLTLPASVRAHIAANPATPRPGGTSSAYAWHPRVAPVAPAPSTPSAPAPSAGSAPAAPSGYGASGGPATSVLPATYAQPAATEALSASRAEHETHVQPEMQAQPTAEVQLGSPAESATAAVHVSSPEHVPGGEPAGGTDPAASAGTQPGAPAAAGAGIPAGEQITEVLRLEQPEGHGADRATGVPGGDDRTGRSEAGFTWAQAVDAQTPATTLAQIAQDAPSLRAALALNPSTYPALLDWLGQLGDAEVDEALRSRSSSY